MNQKQWSISGKEIHPVDGTNIIKCIPPGIYQPQATMRGWCLSKNYEKFEFPYKIYGTSNAIINRVLKTWEYTQGTLGILFNGIKGTGKSVTIQLIANNLIEQSIPIILINNPFEYLAHLIDSIEQDCIFIFDEFQKKKC